jgi:hypothetical protein
MVIFKGAYHLRKYFDNNMDPDTFWARSESGFSNDRLRLKYLKHFNKFTFKGKRGQYRLLIFDSHGSHLTQDFIDFYWQHRIRPFQLPPYLIYLLQPLDVRVFQSLKDHFKKAIREDIFIGAVDVSKVDFFRYFQRF